MLNLGGLFFTLDADTRGLMTAQRRVERFATDVRAAFRGVAAGTVAPDFAQGLARQERAVVAAMERIKRAQTSAANANLTPRGAREAQVTLERLGNAYENFTRKMAQPVKLNSLDFGRRVQHMNSQIVDAERNIRRLSKEAQQGTNVLHGFGSAALLVQGHFGGVSTRLFALTTLIKEFGATVALGAGTLAGLTVGLGILGTGAIKAGMALQALEKQFTAVSGNALVAQYHLGFVKDVAQQAGLVFEDTGKGFARFLISAQSAGLTLGQTQAAFRGVALSAATMQLTVEDTQGVFRALDQMMSKGTVQAEELRGQLGDRLPGAFVVAAQAMGVTTRELNKMLKAGDVVAAEFVPKFVAAYQKMLGIDPSAPIQTLRAELNRAGNEWTFFLQGINNATNATGILASIVKSFADGLRFLTENMTQLIGIIGAVTGAFVGLGIAMAAPAIISFASTAVLWGQIFVSTARSVGILSASMQVLNVAMAANVFARVISLLASLAAVIGGAVLGYNLLTNAVENNANAGASSIKWMLQYVAQQKAMGIQIRSVTVDMIQQARIMSANQRVALQKSVADLSALNATMMQTEQGVDRLRQQGAGGRGMSMAESELNRQRQAVGAQTKAVQDQMAALRGTMGAMKGLNDVVKLPEAGKGMSDFAKEAKGAKESVDGISNRIKDLRDAAATAVSQLQAMMQPLSSGQDINQRVAAIQDLGEAMRIVNNLSPKELGAAANILGTSADVQSVTNAVADLVGQTRRANDAVQEFSNILGEIQGGERQFRSMGRSLEYLMGAGRRLADPQQLRYFEELGKAEDQLHRLASSGAEGMQALQSITNYLQQIGVEGSNAAEMLANFNLQLANQGDQVRFLEDHIKAMRDLKNEIQDIMDITSATSTGGGSGFLGRMQNQMFGADTGEAMQRAIERGRKVAEVAMQMQAMKFSQADINTETERYLNLLRTMDEESYVFDRTREQAERTRDVWRGFVHEGLNGFKDILTGVNSVTDGLVKMAEAFMDIAWQNLVMAPVDDWLSGLGRSKGEANAAGVDADVARQAMNALLGLGDASKGTSDTMRGQLTQSITSLVGQQVTQQLGTQAVTATMGQLAVAAAACATAITALTAAAGGGGGGGGDDGGSGLFGSILKAVAGSFGGGGGLSFNTSSLAPSLSNIGMDAVPNLVPIFNRAMGGPMKAGSIYQVNETGTGGGEYFIPRVNGYMSPRSRSGGGGTTMIDASTTIDARGATQDTLAPLRAEMAARDARLRSELPYLIDWRTRESSQRLRSGR
jgi:tape measure domain-containing protein